MRVVSGDGVFLARGDGVVRTGGCTFTRLGPLLAAAPQGKRSKSCAAPQKLEVEKPDHDRGKHGGTDDGQGWGEEESVHDSFLWLLYPHLTTSRPRCQA